ncbi:MAG: peptidylprolyl isomerase [Gemmatimonadales bacterium]|jgi:peptidyl-prolyl cis-trans isomerase SurA
MNRITPQAGLRVAGLLWLAVTVAAARPQGAAAQQDPSQLVEGVVAVVGDTAILWTELQELLIQAQAEGVQVPQDRSGFRRFLEDALDSKINEVVLYIHARRAGIVVSDREVSQAVDSRLAQIRRNFPTDSEYQQALAAMGTTAAEFRLRITQRTRVDLVTRQFLQQEYSSTQPVPVSEAEIVQDFEARRPRLGTRPATVNLKQVLVTPQPSEEAQLAARERAEQVLSRLRAGEDFGQLARELSDDIASRENGGDLGWVRQGQLLPEFEEVLFWMRPGQVSNIVETSVGYHIIKLERVRGAERLARHILIRLPVTEQDREAARELAEEVAAALRAGADIDSLIEVHGDPSEQSTLTNYQRNQLPQVYRSALDGATAGDIVGPFFMEREDGGGGKWVVARVSELRPAGEWTLDDVRETLRLDIQERKTIQKIIDDLRAATYIEKRLDGFPLPG